MTDSTTSAPQYRLGNAPHANCRLNLGHFLTLRQFNNDLLHPRIMGAFSDGLKTPNLRIADVCCGTGIWLVDVSHVTDESSELHAFDLNIGGLPHAAWIPKIKSSKHNLYEAPPTHLEGTFDIVNISLALTFVPDALLDSAVTNLLAFLKPGGWLQWTEADPLNSSAHASTPTASIKYMEQLVPGTWEFLGLPFPTWIPKLDAILASRPDLEQGSVACIRPQPDLSMVKAWTELYFMGADELFAAFSGSIQPGSDTQVRQEKSAKLRTIVDGAWTELVRDGSGYWTQLTRVIGKKQAI